MGVPAGPRGDSVHAIQHGTWHYFLVDSLEDYIHGVMAGNILIEENSSCEEMIWKSLYFKQLESNDREAARAMIRQVETKLNMDPGLCNKY